MYAESAAVTQYRHCRCIYIHATGIGHLDSGPSEASTFCHYLLVHVPTTYQWRPDIVSPFAFY